DAAARLSPAPAERSRRIGLSAAAAWAAGERQRALVLVREGLRGGADGALRAELLALSGTIEQFTGDQREAYRQLLEATLLVRRSDPQRAATIAGQAADSCMHLEPEAFAELAAVLGALALPPVSVAAFRRHLALSQEASHRGSDDAFRHMHAATALYE